MKDLLFKLLQSYKEAIHSAPNVDEVCADIPSEHVHQVLMETCPQNDYDMRAIALVMIENMEEMLEIDGVTDKFNRWLGFLQGVMWCTELRTINEMRDENRPIFKEKLDKEVKDV